MRNLKRALSLALASVMLLGMMVVGTSAASYPDVDENDNVEAIEVLNAVNVMIGDRGNFRPDAAVNRHEMAVIMAKLVLGNEVADNYVGSHPFTDTFPWADKYVAACYENGIVTGTSKTTFSGNQPLTAVQAAAMMLNALGYKDLNKGADDWRAPLVSMANQLRLFNGVTSKPNEQLNRNQVAQLVLNTLKSPVVDLKDGTFNISDGNGQIIVTGGNREYIVRSSRESYAYAINSTESAGNSASGVQGATIELGEHLYNGKLRLEDAADDFDRPARQWEYDGKLVGTYVKDELLRREYTTGVTGKDLYDLLSASTIKDYEVSYYVDGVVDDTIKASNMIRTNDRTYDTTGKGVLTQVFVDHNRKEITIASINTYLAKATADFNDKKDTLSVEVYNAAGTTSKTIEAEEVPGIEGYKKDDYLLVNWAEIGSTGNKMEIVAVSDPETQSDVTVSQYSEESYVITGGTQYDYGKRGIYKNELGDYATGSLKDHSYILYFDKYGYIAGVRELEGTKNYLFLAAYDGTGSHMSVRTFPGAAVFLDGTMSEIQIDVTETNKNLTKNGDGNPDTGGSDANVIDKANYPLLKDGANQYNRWFTYTTTKNGSPVYTLKPAVEWVNGAAVNHWAEQTAHATNEEKINSGSVRVVAATSKPATGIRAYGNDDSVYLTMEIGNVSDDKNTASGAQIGLTKVTGTYTGVQDVDLKVWDKTKNTLKNDSAIIAVFDDDLYIIGAVVVGEDNSNTDSYIYVLDGAKNERYDREEDVTYWEMDAVVDGEIKTVTVKDKYSTIKTTVSAITGTAHPGEDCLLKATYDKDGYITAVATAPADANDDDRYSALDYTKDIEAGYGVSNSDFKTYSVEYASHADSDDKPQTGDFYRVGRTLYNGTKTSSNKYDAGITLGKDGKVIVVQNDRTVVGQKAKRVWEEYSDLQSAIDWLADADTFEGYVSAVLNDNGSAKYIVFNGVAELGTVDDDGSGKTGVVVNEFPRGILNVTSTDWLNAKDVADAIRAYLKDSRIVSVEYDVKTEQATVTYNDDSVVTYDVVVADGATSAELKGAEVVGEVLKAIAPKGVAGSGLPIEVEGNTMITKPADATESTNYVKPGGGVGAVAKSTEDLVRLLVALHNNGAKEIVYGTDIFTFTGKIQNQSGTGLIQSQWVKTPNSTNSADSLVTAIATSFATQIGAATSGTNRISGTIVVDGAEMVIAIDYIKS